MRKILLVAIAAFSAVVVFAQPQIGTFPQNGVNDERDAYYAFTNATIHVDPQTTLQNATLLIKKDRIEAIGTSVTLPAGTVVMDMKGYNIYPSMIDMYSDYGMPDIQHPNSSPIPKFLSDKKGAYDWNMAIKPEINANENFAPNSSAADALRQLGIGSVNTFQHDGIARGSSAFVTLNDDMAQKVVLKDKTAGMYSFDKGTSNQDFPESLMGIIALLRQTYYDAAWYQKAKYTNEYNVSLDSWNALQSLPSIIEVYDKLGILRADKVGDEFNTQYIIKAKSDCYQRIDEIKATNAPLIVSLDFPKPYDVEDPFDAALVSLADMLHWELAPTNPAALQKAGIKFALTTSDLKDKKDFWKNLRKAIDFGLTEQTALASMTTVPAELLGVSNDVGTLQKGKLANFLVTSGDLFDEKDIIFQNWVQGKQYILNAFDFKDIRGKYDLKVGSLSSITLKVDGDMTAPEMKIGNADSSAIKVNFSRRDNLISMDFKPDKDADGVIRLSGTMDGTTWKGQGQLIDGTWVSWTATYKEALPAKKEDEKAEIEMPEGKVMYPFVSYGWFDQPKQETVLFKNATVWTNEADGALQNTDVLISAGKITKIGKNLDAGSARVIDCTGLYVTSGIIDEHSHIAISQGVNEGSQASSAEVRIGDVINSEDINIYRNLSGGVVAAQLLHGSANPIGGQSGMVKLRWGMAPEKMKIANAIGRIKFALGENVKQSNWGDNQIYRYPQTRMGVEQVYMDAFTRAQEYDASWTKYNKSKSGVPPRRDLELDCLVEIMKGQRLITCHSYVQSEITMLMRVAEKFGFRINVFTHILEGYKVADKMKEHGVTGSTFADWWAYKYEVIDAIPYNAAIMTLEGVNTCINSDDGEMARRLNQEAAKTVRYGGMTEDQAWKMVTLNPAKAMKLDDHMGSLKVGKDADVLVWTDDPLSIYAKVKDTFVDGVNYYDADQDQKTKAWIDSERNRLIQKMIKAKQGGAPTQKAAKKEQKSYECDTEGDFAHGF